MESEMEIEVIINGWFDNTSSQMEKHFKTSSQIDILCAGILKTAENYCNAAFLLLKSNHKMPAKALLRILCDLTAKLVWCLLVPSDGKQNIDNVVYKKFQQWQRKTLSENIEMLKSLKESIRSDDELEKFNKDIGDLEKEAEKIKCDKMPRDSKIFEQLHWKTDIYPVCYKQFNNAIHPDLKSMGDLVKIKENKIICLEDSEDDVNYLVGYCLKWAYHVNYFIRRHYNWGVEEMENEYQKVQNSL